MGKYGYHNGEKYWNVRDSEGQFAKGAGAALKKIADLKLPTIGGNHTALEKKKLRAQRRKIGQKMLDNGHPPEKVKAALSLEPAAWPKLSDVKPYNGTPEQKKTPKAPAEKAFKPKAPAPKGVDLSENGHLDAAAMSKSMTPAEVKKLIDPFRNSTPKQKPKIDAMNADQKLILARSFQLLDDPKSRDGKYVRPEVDLYALALRKSVLPFSVEDKASNSVQAEFGQGFSNAKLRSILKDQKNWAPSLTAGEKNMLDVMITERLEAAPAPKAKKKEAAPAPIASTGPNDLTEALTVKALGLPGIEGDYTAVEKKNLRAQRRKIAQQMIDFNYPAEEIKSQLGANPSNWPTLASIKSAGPILKKQPKVEAPAPKVDPPAPKASPQAPEVVNAKTTPSTPKVEYPPKPPFFGGTQEQWEEQLKKSNWQPAGKKTTAKKKPSIPLSPGLQKIADNYTGPMKSLALKSALSDLQLISTGQKPKSLGYQKSQQMQEKLDVDHAGFQSLVKEFGADASLFPEDGVEGVVKTVLLKAMRSDNEDTQLKALAYANYHEILEDIADYEENYGQGGSGVAEWAELIEESPLSGLSNPSSEAVYSLLKKGESVAFLSEKKVQAEAENLKKPVFNSTGPVNLKEDADKAFSSPENQAAFDALPDEQKQHMAALGGMDKIQEKFKSTPWARKDSAAVMQDLSMVSHRMALQDYTGMAYDKINGSLRGKYDTKPSTQKLINSMTSALKTGASKEDMLLVRGVEPTQVMLKAMGMEGGPAFNDTFMERIQSRIGTSFVDKGFGSSSFQSDGSESGRAGFVGPDKLNMRILAPKGTEMMNLAQGSTHTSENEILLQRGTAYTIAGAYRDSKGFWWMDVVVTHQDG